MDQDKGTSEQVVIGRTLSLDRGSALTLLRRISTDRSVMLDLRRLYGEEVNRTALHLLKDDAVLVQLAERIARGDLTISSFRPVERPGPTEGEEGEATAAAIIAAAVEAAKTEEPKPKKWFEIELMDDSDPPIPVPGARYCVELPDGQMVEGELDHEGKARIQVEEPTKCKVTFPDFHEKEWAKS